MAPRIHQVSTPKQIKWTTSTGMVGGTTATWLGIVFAVVSAAAGAIMHFEAELPRVVVIVASVILAVVGAVGGAIGVSQTRKRIAKGVSAEHPEHAIEGKGAPTRGIAAGGALLALVALLTAGAFLVSQPACSVSQKTKDTTDFLSGLSCIVLETVCLGVVGLEPAAQRACNVAGAACRGGRATLSAVLDQLVYEPPAYTVMLFARSPDLVTANEWLALCRAASAAGEDPERLACGIILDGLADGEEVITVPVVE